MKTAFPEPCLMFNDLDKSGWEPGPWMDEPDKVQWVDPATGLDCLIVRQNRSGHLCGYVGVPEGHALFGADFTDVDGAEAHGGLSFSDKCNEDGRICHIPFPGRPEHVWWFGFDCAHAFDLAHFGGDAEMREMMSPLRQFGVEYRDIAFVRDECTVLAESLATATRRPPDGTDTSRD